MSKFAQLQKAYHSVIPKKVRNIFVPLFTKIHRKAVLYKVVKYLKNHSDSLNEEQSSAYQYLKNNGLTVFPGDYKDKYENLEVEVFTDNNSGLKYIFHHDKKLFFRRTFSVEKIQRMYRGLSIEQDPQSPHRYTTDTFKVEIGDTIVEAGAAEASFSLDAVEYAKQIYIFETDPLWVEALEHTFEPWKDKVRIFNKYVTSSSSDSTISLDDITKKYGHIDFLKIDVDGEEMNLMEGFKNSLKEYKTKIAICTYHKQDDEQKLKQFFSLFNYSTEMSKNYMLFFFDNNLKAPYLRRGVLRAQ